MKPWWSRLRPDNFTLALLCTVLLASLLPMHGAAAMVLDDVTDVAIAALFFLHGARLPRESIVAGVLHWRLHLTILACTFVLFPLLGLLFKPLDGWLLTPELYIGVLFLCALPSTVQSSIAFTSMARGNVPAAVCSASLSSILGVFLTPLLLALLAGTEGGMHNPVQAIVSIMLQLLVPFVPATCCVRGLPAGWNASARCCATPTRPPFCWWCIRRSAKRSAKGYGARRRWYHCSPWPLLPPFCSASRCR